MLKLSDKNFKRAILTTVNGVKENMLMSEEKKEIKKENRNYVF